MTAKVPHITICICTFKRSLLLARLLRKLETLKTDGLFTYSTVVVDNDRTESARETVREFSSAGRIRVIYRTEPEQNIALARNKALQSATGEFVAFIDDDEFPSPDWLLQSFQAFSATQAAGILGPVVPHFAYETPAWVTGGRFFDRPRPSTGQKMPWADCRTGNVLLKRDILETSDPAFRAQFGTGGEDVDFFRRMSEDGHEFYWCDEAVVFEEVPLARCSRTYLLKRALLRGANSVKNPRNRLKNALKSLLAVPCYIVALPILAILGQHRFLDYLIRLCDHVARLLAFVGLRLVHQRET